MNQSHLTALYTVLEQMPEGDDKQLIRELAGMAFSALKFASELEFELRTSAPELATPAPIALDAQAPALTAQECARSLDVLLQAGIDRIALEGTIPHIEQIIDFYEQVMDHALLAESITPPELSVMEREVVYAAFDQLIAARVNASAEESEIEAIFAVEDKVLEQFPL